MSLRMFIQCRGNFMHHVRLGYRNSAVNFTHFLSLTRGDGVV